MADEHHAGSTTRGAHARGGEAHPVHGSGGAHGASGADHAGGTVPAEPAGTGMEAQVVALFNEQRAERGLAPLSADAKLREAALAHSADMLAKGYFAHDDARGTWDARIRRSVARSEVGEILSYGQGAYGTPAGMVESWMQSPEHRSIILTSDLRRVGLGLAIGTFKGEDAVTLATADFSD